MLEIPTIAPVHLFGLFSIEGTANPGVLLVFISNQKPLISEITS